MHTGKRWRPRVCPQPLDKLLLQKTSCSHRVLSSRMGAEEEDASSSKCRGEKKSCVHVSDAFTPVASHTHYTHSLGDCSTRTSASSGVPGAGCTSYFHAINGGALTMMLSMRPPSKPNRTPLLVDIVDIACMCWDVQLCKNTLQIHTGNAMMKNMFWEKNYSPL